MAGIVAHRIVIDTAKAASGAIAFTRAIMGVAGRIGERTLDVFGTEIDTFPALFILSQVFAAALTTKLGIGISSARFVRTGIAANPVDATFSSTGT